MKSNYKMSAESKFKQKVTALKNHCSILNVTVDEIDLMTSDQIIELHKKWCIMTSGEKVITRVSKYSNLPKEELKKLSVDEFNKLKHLAYAKSIPANRRSIVSNHRHLLGISEEDINLLSDEDVDKYYRKYVSEYGSKNTICTRISKKFNISKEELNLLSEQEFNNLKNQIYLSALVVKGAKAVVKYGLGDPSKMSEEELMSYSGKSKSKNFSEKTSAEKNESKRQWIITHLSNFYKTDRSVYENKTVKDLNDLYREYLFNSGRLYKTTHEGKGGKWLKGWYFSTKANKDVFFRSSYERDFLIFCDENEKIHDLFCNLSGIKYIFNNEPHWYFPDFMVKVNNDVVMVEIKPKYKLKEELTITKIDAGRKYCDENNIRFVVLTEDEIYTNKNVEEMLCLK